MMMADLQLVVIALSVLFVSTAILLLDQIRKLREARARLEEAAVVRQQAEQQASESEEPKKIKKKEHRRKTPAPNMGECDEEINVRILGALRSSFPTRNGTPRQPQLVPASRGVVTVTDEEDPEAFCRKLAGCTHVWITFVFHSNTNRHKDTFRPKIRPPRLGKAFVGVFSTRTPHRPNAIGLSLCQLEGASLHQSSVQVHLRSLDLVDGTPILAIEPYLARTSCPSDTRVPVWLEEPVQNLPRQAVQWTDAALLTLTNGWKDGKPPLSLYDSAEEVRVFVEQTLAFDIRSVRHKDKGVDGTETLSYRVYLDSIDVEWSVISAGTVQIDHIFILDKPGSTPLNSTDDLWSSSSTATN